MVRLFKILVRALEKLRKLFIWLMNILRQWKTTEPVRDPDDAFMSANDWSKDQWTTVEYMSNQPKKEINKQSIKFPSYTLTLSNDTSRNEKIANITILYNNLSISPCTWQKVETNKMLKLVVDENRAGLIPTIRVWNTSTKVAIPHILSNLGLEEIEKYMDINPNLYLSVKFNKENAKTINNIVINDTETTIYTKSAITLKDYILLTAVSDVIKVPVLMQGRYRYIIAFCIIHIHQQEKMIWSGSLVKVGNVMFLITMSTDANIDEPITLFCVAVAVHEYKYCIINK